MSSFEEDHEDEFFECAGEPNHQTMESSGTNVTSGSHKETSTLPGHEEEEEGAPSEELAQGINALEIEESAIPISSVEKSIETASKYKEDGNAYFRQKDYDNACQAYSQAIEYCPADDKENLAVFYGNRAAAYSMTADYELVIEDCDRALELKPDYVKVMGRRMQAYENIGKIEEALKGKDERISAKYKISFNALLLLQMLSALRSWIPAFQRFHPPCKCLILT